MEYRETKNVCFGFTLLGRVRYYVSGKYGPHFDSLRQQGIQDPRTWQTRSTSEAVGGFAAVSEQWIGSVAGDGVIGVLGAEEDE